MHSATITRDAIIIGDFSDREHFRQELTQRLDIADMPTALGQAARYGRSDGATAATPTE